MRSKDGIINNNGLILNKNKLSQLYICGNYYGNGKIKNYGDVCSRNKEQIMPNYESYENGMRFECRRKPECE